MSEKGKITNLEISAGSGPREKTYKIEKKIESVENVSCLVPQFFFLV